jgi:hypothetical protein
MFHCFAARGVPFVGRRAATPRNAFSRDILPLVIDPSMFHVLMMVFTGWLDRRNEKRPLEAVSAGLSQAAFATRVDNAE